MDSKHILKMHAYRNVPLCYEEAYELGQYALQGCRGDLLAQIQSIAMLCALHNQATYRWQWNRDDAGEESHLPEDAAEQIAGICAAVMERDLAVSEYGFLRPQIPYGMDNCGMGGDLLLTANVSTVAAFIAAAAGIPMVKHGSSANADNGRSGSSDFMELCGIDIYPSKRDVERCVEDFCFGYTDAVDTRFKVIHVQTHNIAKLSHMNDVIGPITNPLSPSLLRRRMFGVSHLVPTHIVAKAYQILNEMGITCLDHGLFVHGFGDVKDDDLGMDEVSICRGGTTVTELKDGDIQEYTLEASNFGLSPVDAKDVAPPCGMSKGDFSMKILQGETSGPPAHMVLANAAMLFYLADESSDLRQCYEMAQEVHESGAAYQRMLAVRERLPIQGRD